MPYCLRFLLYNRWPQPHYRPLGTDTPIDEQFQYQQGKVYRLRLAGSTDDKTTWPEFVVLKVTNQPQQQATLVEVFIVLLSEYKQFVEPFQTWELNWKGHFETASLIGYFLSRSCLTSFSSLSILFSCF